LSFGFIQFLVRCGKALNLDTISEIGIFGIYLHETEHKNDSGIIINNNDGYLVRTKPAQSNVGGVNVGGACIDSLYLVEWKNHFLSSLNQLYDTVLKTER